MKSKIFFMVAMMLFGCEEVVDRPFLSGERKLVVEGVLTNELKQHRIRLTWSVATPNEKALPVSGATVVLSDGTSTVVLPEDPLNEGEYLTPVARAIVGQTYTLAIQYDGKEYFAQDRSEAVEPMPEFSYRAVSGGYVINFEKSGEGPNYIRHEISWVGTPACTTNTCEGLVVSYDLKSIDVNEGTKPAKEEFVIPAGATVVRRKFSLSGPYRRYLRAVLSETEWRGSPFDVDRANAPTNLSNGATGYFAVCSVVVDSHVIK